MKKRLLISLLASSTLLTVQAQTSMKALQISTTENDTWHVYPAQLVANSQQLSPTISFSDDRVTSTFRSFGTCFNELDWHALNLLTEEQRQEFFHRFFAPTGDLRFTLGRIPIGASDYAGPADFYSPGKYTEANAPIDLAGSWYSCDEVPRGETDFEMEHFTIERDRQAIIPYIKRALAENPQMRFWASPWSPPQWFKHSEHYSNRSGYGNGLDTTYPSYSSTQFKMEEPYLQAYPKYFSRFIEAYADEGIKITGLCYQNEAYTCNFYPNTSWKPEDTGRFNADYFIPYIKEHHPDVQIWLGTLNTRDLNVIRTILNYRYTGTDPKYVGKTAYDMFDGIGFQWEGRDAIGTIRNEYPNMDYLQTESECGSGTFDWGAGVHTFELIHHYLNNGCIDYTNWNAILGGNGRGPFMNWHQNGIVHVDLQTFQPRYTPEFYAYKHYSHFIGQDDQILEKQGWTPLVLCARRTDGCYVVVVGNEQTADRHITIGVGGEVLDVVVPAKSMNTFLVGLPSQIDLMAAEEGLTADAQPYSSPEITFKAETDYYLWNVGQRKFLSTGYGFFSQQAGLDSDGLPIQMEASTDGEYMGVYFMRTPTLGTDTYWGWADEQQNQSGLPSGIDAQYYLNATKKERLSMQPTQTGAYQMVLVDNGGKRLAWTEAFPSIVYPVSDPVGTNSLWRFYTSEQRDSVLRVTPVAHKAMPAASQEVYLYNVAEKLYLAAGGRSGVGPDLDETGTRVLLKPVAGRENVYTLTAPEYGASSCLAWDGRYAGVEGNYFFDMTSNAEQLVITPAEDSQEFIIQWNYNKTYFAFKRNFVEGEIAWGDDIDGGRWLIFTPEEREATMAISSLEIENRKSANSKYYDLQGRPVVHDAVGCHSLRPGIYISAGRKHVRH